MNTPVNDHTTGRECSGVDEIEIKGDVEGVDARVSFSCVSVWKRVVIVVAKS
jgi:hypothetical protein